MTIDKIKAVLASVVLWINIAVAILVIVADELTKTFSDGSAQTVITIIARIVIVLAGVVNIITRVTPVLPSQRGLTLPKGAPTSVPIPPSRWADNHPR